MGFNQNRFCILCLISIFILGSADKVRASALETWVEQSDIICTARVLTVDKSYTERVMMHGYPYLATSVTLRVRVPIKGSIADQQILVKTQRADLSNILTGAGYYPFYNGFKVGENYILFAKKNMEAGSYSLTNPYDETQSAVSIKDPTFDIPTDGSVIDRTVIYLANELSVGNKAQKLYDLGLLGDYGKSLLTTRLTRYNPIDATRAASMHLMKTKITSAVLKLTTDSDSEIHDLALLNAAELQVPQVIPQLELLS